MPGKNKTPLLGWHPPAGLGEWVRAEAKRRGAPISEVLNEAVEAYRAAKDRERELEEIFAAPEPTIEEQPDGHG
jgi:hypothetical protein